MKYIWTYKICDWHIACNQDWISNVKGIEADDMPWIILGPSFLFFAAALLRRKSFILWQKTSFNQSKNFLILVKSFFFFWNKCLVRSREEVHFNLEGKHLNYSIRCKYWKEKGTTAPKKSVLDKQNIEAAPSSQWLKNVPKSLICWEFLTKQFGQNQETFFKK